MDRGGDPSGDRRWPGRSAAGRRRGALNVTATNGTANGDYLSVWPAGTTQPTVSNVNVDAHRTVASAVTVRLGTGADEGKIAVYNAGGTQDVLIDVVGYFETGSGQAFFPLTPGRLIDSRPVPNESVRSAPGAPTRNMRSTSPPVCPACPRGPPAWWPTSP